MIRCRRHVGGQRSDELLSVVDGEGTVVELFVSDGAGALGSHGPSAEGAGAVGRVDLAEGG